MDGFCSLLFHWFPGLIPSFSLPHPFLWQKLLDSTFSWYLGAAVFPLMPSQEDKEDEDEDAEPLGEKAKRKTPEEGNRPPSDLARHDVIKVKVLQQLPQSLDLQGKHMLGKRGSARPGAQLLLAVGCVSDPQGLLATNLLPRLRYLLEVTCPGPSVVLDILAVLIRLARHSLESATRVRTRRRQKRCEEPTWAWS